MLKETKTEDCVLASLLNLLISPVLWSVTKNHREEMNNVDLRPDKQPHSNTCPHKLCFFDNFVFGCVWLAITAHQS